MGIFDFFKKSDASSDTKKTKSQRDLARLTRVVGAKLAQDYDRQEAIAQLAAMADADGARALLKRFDFNMEPSITDQDEKEQAAAGIVAAGSAALAPLRDYCARAESMTWPLKILRQIVEPDHFTDEVLELLEQFDTEYVRNPEPKIQLISVLEEHPSDEVRLAIEPFLTDVNENVRFTAVGTVFAMDDAVSVPPLAEALLEEESIRIKNRICGGLIQKEWPLPAKSLTEVGEALPDNYELSGNKLTRLG